MDIFQYTKHGTRIIKLFTKIRFVQRRIYIYIYGKYATQSSRSLVDVKDQNMKLEVMFIRASVSIQILFIIISFNYIILKIYNKFIIFI